MCQYLKFREVNFELSDARCTRCTHSLAREEVGCVETLFAELSDTLSLMRSGETGWDREKCSKTPLDS